MPPNSFVALDLEFNQPSRKIIQIGLATGSASAPEELKAFSWLIDPHEPISPEIQALTGIADKRIAEKAVPAGQAAAEMAAVLMQANCFVNPVTWGGGDLEALKTFFQAEAAFFPFFGRRCIDVKTFHSCLCFAKAKIPNGGLGKVMRQYGLSFEGHPHRADVDALNTLRLFFHLMIRQKQLESSVTSSR